MATIQWEYYMCACSFKVTKKGGLLGSDEGIWTLQVGEKELDLYSGLKSMGDSGFELVALHQTMEFRGGTGSYYYPTYLYIFKRPN